MYRHRVRLILVQLELVLFSLALLSSLTSGAIAFFAWRNRGTASAPSLAVLMLAIANWSLSQAFMVMSGNEALKTLFLKWSFVTIVIVPVLWLYFAFEYTGRTLSDRAFLSLLAIPVVSLGMVWTNEAHNLFWTSVELHPSGATLLTSHGPWFWVHATYSYALLAGGSFLIFQMLVLSNEVYRGQAVALLAAVVAPWIGNAAHLLGLTNGIDITPLTFTFSGVVLFGAVFRYELLDVVPIAREVARDEIIENLDDPVVVLDSQGRVADANPAGREIIDYPLSDIVGHSLDELVPDLAEALKNGGEEVALSRDGVKRYYDVRVLPLYRGKGLFAGKVVSLRDITDRKKREQRLDVLNRVLRHDLRNNMNIIHGNAELINESPAEASERVDTIMNRAIELIDMSNEVRRIEDMLDKENISKEHVDVVGVIWNALEDMRSEYPEVEVDLDAPEEQWVYANKLLEPAIENIIENAVEHNDSSPPRVQITVESGDEYVEVSFADNGPGIPDEERDVLVQGEETQLRHTSGIGLWFVNWVIDEIDGSIRFEENEPRGSVVTLILEIADT